MNRDAWNVSGWSGKLAKAYWPVMKRATAQIAKASQDTCARR